MRLVLDKKSVILLMMRSSGKLAAAALLGLTLALPFGSQVWAAMDTGPYRAIIDRNIFNTQPMPPPPPPAQPPPPALPNVKLVGLLKLAGRTQAVIWYQEPGAPPKLPVTAVLVAGQRDGEITVLDIDVPGKSARVQIREDIKLLALEDKPVGTPASPAPGGPRVRPGNPGLTPPPTPPTFGAPPASTFRNSAPNPAPGNYNPTQGAYNNGAANATADASTFGGGVGQTLPTRQVRTDTPDESQMTPEQQMILIEAQRDAMLRSGNSAAVLLPPTPLGNMMNQPAGGAAH